MKRQHSACRLGVGGGDALVIDVLPVDVALVGRDIIALCASALHEVLDREAEGSGGRLNVAAGRKVGRILHRWNKG